MTNKKLTKRDYFNALIAIVNGREVEIEKEVLIDFLNHEIELISKKNSSTKPTKTRQENEILLNEIFEVLKNINKPVTISELQALNTEMAKYSNQKLSAMLKKLIDSDKIVKIVDKKKSYFTIK